MLQDACRAAMTVQELVEIAVAQARVAVTAAAGVLFQLDGEDWCLRSATATQRP